MKNDRHQKYVLINRMFKMSAFSFDARRESFAKAHSRLFADCFHQADRSRYCHPLDSVVLFSAY